jgi:CubicO group peptidase (beta-lactamase class C family)
MKKVVTLFLFFTYIVSFAQEVQKRQITTTQMDSIFSKWDTSDKPGIAVGVVSDGNILFTKGYGLANMEHKIPINTQTKFPIGDIAKEFTVFALLLLEERGQLSLQDDIRKYMPDLIPFSHSISIEKLIHHTSGLNNEAVSKALAGWTTEDTFTKKQAYTMLQNQVKSLSTSGSVQRTSDAGFMILEDLIAKIAKMSYPDFIIKEVFEPLGMKNSVFDTQGDVIVNKAQGYYVQNDGFRSSSINRSHTIVSDVYTTVGDMCLWAKELGDPQIGTNQMVKKFDDFSVINNEKTNKSNRSLLTGGQRFWDYRGTQKLYHIEVAGGYASKLIRYPEYNHAIIVMGNDGAYNGDEATAASELHIEDFLNPWPSNESVKINSKKLSKKQLSAFEGNYWDADSHSTRKIHIANDTLMYFRSQGNESALVPLTKNSFKMITWGEVGVSFHSNANPMKMAVTVGEDDFHLTAFDTNASWTKDLDVFTGNYYAVDLGTSYSLSIDKEGLILNHPRLEPVRLDPRIPDVFTGDRRHYSSLSFKKNTNGTITGFYLATDGVADIWFQRETSTVENFAKTK